MDLLVPKGGGKFFNTATNTSHPIIIIIIDGQDLAKGRVEGGKIKPGEKRWRNGNAFKILRFVVYY